MKVFKAHSDGNDYLVSWLEEEFFHRKNVGEIAKKICNRHTGIGSDGIVFLQGLFDGVTPSWDCRIFNPDGSEAEVSGNGIRCAAACLCYLHADLGEELLFMSQSGPKKLKLLQRKKNQFTFESDMGEPVFESDQIPMKLLPSLPLVQDYPLRAGDQEFLIHALSIGNPHCVIFCLQEEPLEWEHWSALIAHQECFPHQSNVEWVKVLSPQAIDVTFWERGVGPTTASGSGSCAAAIISILTNRTQERVTVKNRNGEMIVQWRPGERVLLTGTAEVILEGTCLLAGFA